MTESQQLIDTYLSYIEDGEDGFRSHFDPSYITIIQEVDDEEPSKYIISRDDVTEDEWGKINEALVPYAT